MTGLDVQSVQFQNLQQPTALAQPNLDALGRCATSVEGLIEMDHRIRKVSCHKFAHVRHRFALLGVDQDDLYLMPRTRHATPSRLFCVNLAGSSLICLRFDQSNPPLLVSWLSQPYVAEILRHLRRAVR